MQHVLRRVSLLAAVSAESAAAKPASSITASPLAAAAKSAASVGSAALATAANAATAEPERSSAVALATTAVA